MIELERWTNFYLLMSAAAATLIGLLFVVITLADERRLTDIAKIKIYLTPTVIYFASVLFLAALLTFPDHTRITAASCICLVGIFGLVYSGSFYVRSEVRKGYYRSHDRVAYAAFPLVAFGALGGGGVLTVYAPKPGLTLVAVGMLLLLAIAIRNSWAIAVGVVSAPSGRQNPK